MTNDLITTIKDHLFSTPEEMKKARIPQQVQDRLLRIRDMYNFWKLYPHTADKDIVAEIRRRYSVCVSVAYEDLRHIKTCIGAFSQVTKDWDRYRFHQMIEKGYEIAVKNGDANAIAKLAAALGKYSQLDKDEKDLPAYSDIVVQVLEPTSDPSSLGFKPIPNFREKAHKLLKKWDADIEEVDYEEVES